MSMTNVHELAVLDANLGVGATLLGATVEIALSTADPGEDGTGLTEPVGNGYARVTVNNDGAAWGPATLVGGLGTKVNLTSITFPSASGGPWGLITHWAMVDSGTVKFSGEIDDGAGTPQPRQVNNTDLFRFLAGALRITLD